MHGRQDNNFHTSHLAQPSNLALGRRSVTPRDSNKFKYRYETMFSKRQTSKATAALYLISTRFHSTLLDFSGICRSKVLGMRLVWVKVLRSIACC
jgi:hypothetical protein